MRGNNEQVSACCIVGRFGHSRACLAAVLSPLQPKGFHAASVVCLPGAEELLKTDYRGVVAQLADSPSLREAISLEQVPHYTTLQKAARRLLASVPVKRLLNATVRRQLGPQAARAAGGHRLDRARMQLRERLLRAAPSAVGTPWKTVVYRHYRQTVGGLRRGLAFHPGLPRRSRPQTRDVNEFQPLRGEALARVRITRITADAGYDSEANHRYAREECRIRTIIPPNGRPTTTSRPGPLSPVDANTLRQRGLHERVQVETVVSMVKRRLEGCVRGTAIGANDANSA